MTDPDKQALRALLVAELTAALEAARRAHQSAIEGAFHEEAKAENDKDTRGLEQSYLARGVAQRVADLEVAVAQVAAMPVDPATRATIGAAVAAEDADDASVHHYFIAPAGGGTTIHDHQVVTLSSPLGRALLDKVAGDEVELKLPKQRRTLIVKKVV